MSGFGERRRGLRSRAEGATSVGLERSLNEDAYLLEDAMRLWAVADGMGGHEAGEYASQVVIEHLRRTRTHWRDPRALAADIEHRLEEANAELRAEAKKRSVSNIGSTVVCLAMFGEHALVVWVGDSRAYLMRERPNLKQLTHDHTVVQDLVDIGEIEPGDVETHPMANVITRAVGAEDAIEPSLMEKKLRSGDRLMLCSDGLTRVVPEGEIARILSHLSDPFEAAEALVEATLKRGAPDNVTVMVIDVS